MHINNDQELAVTEGILDCAGITERFVLKANNVSSMTLSYKKGDTLASLFF